MADASPPPSIVRPDQVTLDRIEEQLAWYDRKAGISQRRFKLLKAATIVSAALIPVLTTAAGPYALKIAAGLGVLIAVVEGLQQMNQYLANWLSYRSTAEALKHEKFLYLGKAGPYANSAIAAPLLAERVEAVTSQENAKWFTVRSHAPKDEEEQK